MTQATSYKLFFISLAISLVALFLRIYELDAESLWLDEAYAVNHVADRGFLEVLSRSLPDGNPPLYYILLDHWIWLFGGSEYSVRMPSVLFSVFSVGLIYKVGSLLLDKATGLLASLIFALSAYQVHFAQEARVYSMMVFLCLSSFYFFLRLFQGKNYRIFAGYVLSSAALMYSHYFGLFIVIAQALFVLGFYFLNQYPDYSPTFDPWANAPLFRTWALAAGAITILYTPGFFYLAYSLAYPEHRTHIQAPGLRALGSSFLQYAGAPGFGYPEFQKPVLILAVIMLFALVGVRVLAKNREQRVTLFLLLVWLIVPVASPFLLSQIITPLYGHRYSIAALPALYLLVAAGAQRVGSIATLSTMGRLTSLAAFAVVGLLFSSTLFLSLSMLHDYFTTAKKEPWRQVVSYVKVHSKPGDALLISPRYMILPYDYYAKGNGFPNTSQEEIPLDREQINEFDPAAIGSNRVWLLLSPSYFDNEQQAEQFKEELEDARFALADHQSYDEGIYPVIDLALYEKQ
jgi:uncharacterized membrane protein